MAKKQEFGIGEMSRRTGVNIETVRYYEKIGLMPRPPRTEGGHRLYVDDHLKRLTFVRRCRELGFTLEEVRHLLSLVGGNYTCGEVRALAREHVKGIRRKIADLRRMERMLAETAARCQGGDVPECPIIDVLSR